MNPYARLRASAETPEAAALAIRLAAWHDAMVAHERRIRLGRTDRACHDECAHALAQTLWRDALATFGSRAHELIFLRASATRPAWSVVAPPTSRRAAAAGGEG